MMVQPFYCCQCPGLNLLGGSEGAPSRATFAQVQCLYSVQHNSSTLRDQRHYSSATNYDEHGYVDFHSGKGCYIVITRSNRWEKRQKKFMES